MRFTLVVLLFSYVVFAQDAGQQTQQIAVQQAQQAQQVANQQMQQAQQDTNQAAQESNNANARANQQMTDAVAAVAANTQGGNLPAAAVTRTPKFSPKPGTFKGGNPQVTITAATKGAVIYYTTDGSAPTLASQRYTGPIPLSQTTTIKAIAIATTSGQSAIAQGKYIIK